MTLKSSLLILLIICFCSCDDSRVFDEYKSTGTSWSEKEIVTFDFEAPDTIHQYDLLVNLRNTNDYQFSNLFLIVALENLKGDLKVDTLEYLMTKPDGTFLGTGFSDVKENKLLFKEGFKFDTLGNYQVRIEQAVRKRGSIVGENPLRGVTDVGFRIEKKQ
uniref:gliding motility lipoprotein GldH n=1 Tax=Flavobacterium sp. TaxID=239 RepID=UPI00404B3341